MSPPSNFVLHSWTALLLKAVKGSLCGPEAALALPLGEEELVECLTLCSVAGKFGQGALCVADHMASHILARSLAAHATGGDTKTDSTEHGPLQSTRPSLCAVSDCAS